MFAQCGRVMQIAHAVDQVDQKAHFEEPVELDFLVMYDLEQAASAAGARSD